MFLLRALNLKGVMQKTEAPEKSFTSTKGCRVHSVETSKVWVPFHLGCAPGHLLLFLDPFIGLELLKSYK